MRFRYIWVTSVVVAFASSACQDTTQSGVQSGRYALAESDGTLSLYSGNGVAERLQSGQNLESITFMKLRVSASLVERARRSSSRVVSLSLEEASAEIIDIQSTRTKASANPDSNELEIVTFRPGQPWLSGVAQVALDPETDQPLGFFKVIEWKPPIGGSGRIGANYYSTVLVPDENMPHLKYASSATKNWAALPTNWK
jgi:hypothetical protein